MIVRNAKKTLQGKKTQNSGNVRSSIGAVIFDLDGTLVDSEPNYLEADRKWLAEYGVMDFTVEMKKKYIGRSSMYMVNDIKKIYGIDESPEILVDKKNRYYIEIAKEKTLVFPEMRKLLKILHGLGLRLAVASGSSKSVIDMVVSSTGIEKYFDILLSAEAVAKGKPSPDIFLEASRLLNVSPGSCLVIEDSAAGVEAAKAADMYCVAIPYSIGASDYESYGKADLLFSEGMTGFSAQGVLDWMKTI